MTAAETFLAKKLREYVAQNNVPALAAVLVRDAGRTVVSGQQGIRKVGGIGDRNVVQATDRFNIGSISKVLTAHLIGAMIDANTPGLSWTSTLGQVMPDLPIPNPVYKDVTIDQYSVHVSGMPGSPEGEGIYEPAANAAGLGTLTEVQRRLAYVKAAVAGKPITQCAMPADSACTNDGDHHTLTNTGIHDPGVAGEALCEPGQCVNYSGGQVINAAMLERLTGRVYDDLMQSYLFGPLGMTRSRFGRSASGDDDGPWQHDWDATARRVVPRPDGQLAAYDTHPRNPVGGICTSAADLGRFLAESIRPDPQLFHLDTLTSMQTHMVAPVSAFTRGAWVSENPGDPTANVQYEGNNGYAVAFARCLRSQQKAIGAMCNMNAQFGDPAIGDMHNTAYAFDKNWDTLFGAGAPEPLECSHQMPALVATGTGGTALTVFARRHDGTLTVRQSSDGGHSWGTENPIPAWKMTSGLAATASQNGTQMFVFGRGTDNQIWYGKSSDTGHTWQLAGAVPFGTFSTGPAVARSTNGSNVGLHLVAIGMDRRMYYIHSSDGGAHWGPAQPIGNGTFTSAPAIVAADNGNLVRVFARGDDFRLWENANTGGGWQPHWQPIGQGLFTSGPAATASFDAAAVHLFARGTDRAIWHNWAIGAGQPWQPHYKALPSGTFMSAPAAAADQNAQTVYVAAFGDDFTRYLNKSTDSGATWAGPGQVGPPNSGLFI
jgi:CubicO group peptidase (beta-lactamase class C family)